MGWDIDLASFGLCGQRERGGCTCKEFSDFSGFLGVHMGREGEWEGLGCVSFVMGF